MAFLLAAYTEDEVKGEKRTVLRLHHRIAPYKVAVLPLSKKDKLVPVASRSSAMLQRAFMCDYDETQAIGKRYRRQDEIGTPYCVTIDFDTLEDRLGHRSRPRHHGPGPGADRGPRAVSPRQIRLTFGMIVGHDGR
ncbi:MAG: His/Gly/Thr/Pro-type tRNA ligase C-terminal domain-containing protein [Microthrixaceae bacterium]